MTYIASKAWHCTCNDSRFNIYNVLTGRSYTIAHHIAEVLTFCKTAKAKEDIVAYLNKYIPSTSIDATISALIRKNLLVADEGEEFIDTIPAHPTLWGCANSPNSNTKIVVMGAPFGLGNSIDIRCKDFPTHLRSCVWSYYSFRKLVDNVARIDPMTISPWFNRSKFEKIIKRNTIVDIGDVIYYCGETSEMFYARMEKISEKVLNEGCVPVIIGGDHSITFSVVSALNKMKTPFIVLHFDAHADMIDGVVMKLHEQLGNRMINHANVIKSILGFNNVTHVYQFGVREPLRYDDIKITQYCVCDINSSKTIKKINELDLPIYITFDVDFFDPSIAPGTASILPNGGEYGNTLSFLSQILKHKRILGVDIVEANPALDTRNQTTLLVNNLLIQIISQIEI